MWHDHLVRNALHPGVGTQDAPKRHKAHVAHEVAAKHQAWCTQVTLSLPHLSNACVFECVRIPSEISLAFIARQEKTKEEREAELIPKIAEAMRLGVSVLDSAFDKLDVDEAHSDSDEDGKAPRRTAPILEPKVQIEQL